MKQKFYFDKQHTVLWLGLNLSFTPPIILVQKLTSFWQPHSPCSHCDSQSFIFCRETKIYIYFSFGSSTELAGPLTIHPLETDFGKYFPKLKHVAILMTMR